MNTLGELFLEARQYGMVKLFTIERGYHADITFVTSKQVKLTAQSKFDHATPEEALQMAIQEARNIVDSIRPVALEAAPGALKRLT